MQGEQVALFEKPVVSRKLDNHLLLPKPLEDFMPEIVPGKHMIYPTGGWHYFCKQAPKGSIYTKNIWPFITVQTPNKVRISSIYFSDATNYMMVSLYDKQNKGVGTKPKMMHVIVAKAYIWNSDPEIYYQVAHLGDDKCNYLPDNLEYQTSSQNHTGMKSKRTTTKEEDYTFAKARGFIKL